MPAERQLSPGSRLPCHADMGMQPRRSCTDARIRFGGCCRAASPPIRVASPPTHAAILLPGWALRPPLTRIGLCLFHILAVPHEQAVAAEHALKRAGAEGHGGSEGEAGRKRAGAEGARAVRARHAVMAGAKGSRGRLRMWRLRTARCKQVCQLVNHLHAWIRPPLVGSLGGAHVSNTPPAGEQ